MNQSILEKKKAEAARIEEALKSSQSVVIVSYHNLDVKTINGLRKSLKENGGKFEVAKNTIMKKALDDEHVSAKLDELLSGPNALITGAEETKILKTIVTFVAHHKEMEIRGAVIGGVYCDPEKIHKLSFIEDKNAALSVLVGALASPVSSFARALKAVADKMPKEAAAA